MRIAPPTRTSNSQTGLVNPFGPHHCAVCFASVHALNTSSRGASNSRVITRSHSEDPRALIPALYADMLLLLLFIFRILFVHFPQIVVEPVETLLPKPPVVFHPTGHVLQRARLQAAGP